MSVDASDDDDFDDEDGNIEHTYLTFCVGVEEYAVPVARVTEIVRLQKSYAMPDVPSYIRGVLNLRGKVIPLIDVRSRFGMPESGYTDRTVVVVLDLGDATTGLIVDAVTEVVEILPAQIEPRSGIAGGGASPMVMGVGKRANGVSFILDVHAMLAVPPPAVSRLLAAD